MTLLVGVKKAIRMNFDIYKKKAREQKLDELVKKKWEKNK